MWTTEANSNISSASLCPEIIEQEDNQVLQEQYKDRQNYAYNQNKTKRSKLWPTSWLKLSKVSMAFLGKSFAQTEDEIGKYSCLVIQDGDATLNDKNLTTGYEVPESDFINQVITYDWSGCGGVTDTEVNAILIETDESRMTSGLVKFYIDDVECTDTNSVGVDAVGGLFNCGLTGSSFTAKCTIACSPYMSIREIVLWKDKAMTLDGTIY